MFIWKIRCQRDQKKTVYRFSFRIRPINIIIIYVPGICSQNKAQNNQLQRTHCDKNKLKVAQSVNPY